MYKKLEELPLMLTPKDIKEIFNIGIRQAYELVHTEGFPSMKTGHVIRIYKPQLIEWITQQTQGHLI